MITPVLVAEPGYPDRKRRLILAGILLVGAFLIGSPIPSTPPHYDEPQHVLVGERVLQGHFQDQTHNPGAVFLYPILAAQLYRAGGLMAVRAMNLAWGLVVLACVYLIGRHLFGDRAGLTGAGFFLLQGPVLHLFHMGFYDATALAGVAVSAALLASLESHPPRPTLRLLGAAGALGLAVATKNTGLLYAPLAVAMVLWRQPWRRAVPGFVLPLAGLLLLYFAFVFLPYREEITGWYRFVVANFSVPADWIHNNLWRWTGIPFFLAAVGALWAGRGRSAILLIFLALPVPLTYLLSSSDWAIHKHLVYPLLFLAPAAGWGIVKTGERYRGPGWLNLEPILFVGLAVLLLFHGVRESADLDRRHPSMDRATGYLAERLLPEDLVMANADHVLRYLLRDRWPPDRVAASYWMWHEGQGGEEGARSAVASGLPTFVVLDEFYGPPRHRDALVAAMHGRYRLVFSYEESTSLGPKTVWIYRRIEGEHSADAEGVSATHIEERFGEQADTP